jgi:predicted O-methyltransferase YrrM
MLRKRLSQIRALRGGRKSLRRGQLDNPDLEALITGAVQRGNWGREQERLVVEVGTGGGRGSTVAIHRALAASNCPVRLVGYEGDSELAMQASRYWRDAQEVEVVNEYFMSREDIDLVVKPWVAPADRDAYLPEFDALETKPNFLVTLPPGPIDLLFVDSVRYTHLAIMRAAAPWLQPETLVVMEDDIPGYGELANVESEFELLKVARHEIGGHQWPLVEFRIVTGPGLGTLCRDASASSGAARPAGL